MLFFTFSCFHNLTFAQDSLVTEPEIVIAEVTLNGQLYGSSIIAIDEQGELYAREESLFAWNIQKPYPQSVQINGQEFFPISTLGDYTSELDTATYELTIALSAEAFQRQIFDIGERKAAFEKGKESGLFLDYDINLQHDSLFGDKSGFVLKPVIFSSMGHWVSRVSWQNNADIADQEKFIFLENYFRHDNPEKQTTLIVGDSIAPPGTWSHALSFTGIQYGRNFALQPREITFPLPAIIGEAVIPSTLDLFVNQSQVANNTATPGLFEIRDIPIVNGAGELQLVVTDTLGRQTIIESNFYASSELLKKGLSTYSVNLGVLRNNVGIENFSYGNNLGVLDYQYGLNNFVTLNARAESDTERNNVGVGGTVNLWHKGILNAAFASSDQNNSSITRLGYQYSDFRYRLNLAYQYAEENYGLVGASTIVRQPRQQFTFNTGVYFNNVGSLGVSYIDQSFHSGDDFTVASLNFQTNIKKLFSVSAYLSQVSNGQDDSLTFGVSFTRSLGGERSYNVDYSAGTEGDTARAQFNKFVPYGEGTGYNVAISDNSSTYSELEANWIKRGRQYALDVEARQRNSETGLSAGLSGSMSMIGGRVEFSREVQNAFALVQVADIPDVRVYLENQLVGKTDSEGYLLVPALRPYDGNKLNIAISDLPIETQIVEFTKVISPRQNSGRVVNFDVSIPKNYQFIAMKSASEIMDEGSLIYLTNPDLDKSAQDISLTGYNGLVFLNLSGNEKALYIRSRTGVCSIAVESLLEYEPLKPSESLSKIVCQTL